jgi:predicted Zn-dependent protease
VPEKTSALMATPLKNKLMVQSEKKLIDDDPRAAIVLAERGLRVDRKEPRFYQVLASAYNALANPSQSVYFAKQGLRYAKKGSEVHQSLSRWLQ